MYPVLNEKFKDILQELRKAELDDTLGYQKGSIATDNERNRYLPKTNNSQMGNVTSTTDTMLRTTAYTYDAENNLTSITDPAGRKHL